MAIPTNQKKITLNDGREIPVIGLGTYLSAPNEVTQAVVAGWKSGMRHFDCAQFYKVCLIYILPSINFAMSYADSHIE